jgi:hypothetical protein
MTEPWTLNHSAVSRINQRLDSFLEVALPREPDVECYT